MKKIILVALLILLAAPVFASTRRLYENFDDQVVNTPLHTRAYGLTDIVPPQHSWQTGRGGTGYCFSSGTIHDVFVEWIVGMSWYTDELYFSYYLKYPSHGESGGTYWNAKFEYLTVNSGGAWESCANGHGTGQDGSGFFTQIRNDAGTPVYSDWLGCLTNSWDTDWHHYEFYINRTSGIYRFWYDETLCIDQTFGQIWSGSTFVISTPSIDASGDDTFTRSIDDLEIWDGMPTGGGGATYYVRQSATGSGDALSLANAAAIATFNAGTAPFNSLADDTVYFDGTFTTGLNTPCGGSADHLVTLDLTSATWNAVAQQQLDIDQPYVRVQNALLITVADTGSVPTGIIIREDNIQIDNCIIVGQGIAATRAYSSGIYVSTSAATGFIITRNNISHVCIGIWTKTQGLAGTIGGLGMGNIIHHNDARVTDGADGIDIGTDRVVPQMEDYTGLVISYNTIYECPDDGIDLYYGSNVIVEHNEVGPQTTAGGDSNGIKCGSDNNAVYNIIRYNYIHDYTAWAETIGYDGGIVTNSADHTFILSNYIYNCFRGITISWNSHGHLVANNTISAAQDRGVSFGDEVLSSTFQNNICDGANYDLVVNATSENIVGGYNCFLHDLSHPAGDYTNTGSSDLFATNPLLTGYVLGATSPCINTGTTIADVTTDIRGVTRPQGSAYEIGAYEIYIFESQNYTFGACFSGVTYRAP